VRVQIPLEDEPTVSVNVDMARAVVALPRQKDVVLSADLAHPDMLPLVVTDATSPGAAFVRRRLLVQTTAQRPVAVQSVSFSGCYDTGDTDLSIVDAAPSGR